MKIDPRRLDEIFNAFAGKEYDEASRQALAELVHAEGYPRLRVLAEAWPTLPSEGEDWSRINAYVKPDDQGKVRFTEDYRLG